MLQEEKLAKKEREERQRLLKKRMERWDYSENILVEMSCENLGSFYSRAIMELADFWDLFGKDSEIKEKHVK